MNKQLTEIIDIAKQSFHDHDEKRYEDKLYPIKKRR